MNTLSPQQTTYQIAPAGFSVELLSDSHRRDRFDIVAWLGRVPQQSLTSPSIGFVPEEVKRGGFSSLAASPEAGRLREYSQTHRPLDERGSIFDLPPLDLGRVLLSLDADNDLLSEMLDDTRL